MLGRATPRAVAAVTMALWSTGCVATAGAPVRPQASPEHEDVGLFRFAVRAPAGLSPTDMVPLEAVITEPDGREVRVMGFVDGDVLRVRYRPRKAGEHRYVVRVMDGERELERHAGTFIGAPGASWGGIRRDPVQPALLRDEQDAPFFMLGDNRINVYDPRWNYEELEPVEYVHHLADHGITTMRVFIFGDAEGEELPSGRQLGALEPTLGVFDPQVARDFDRIFAAAESRGVRIILTAFAVGFTPGDVWKGWEDNPYSQARGGPCAHPYDFFTNPDAVAMAEQRIRYIAARWADSPAFLAIDLLNEPEWDGDIPESLWIPWAEAMVRTWRAAAPYGRLVTAGPVGPSWTVDGDEAPWYRSELNDIVQWHLYGPDYYEPHAVALEMTKRVRESLRYDKPILCGEFGYGGESTEHYPHTHLGAFAAAFSGAGALGHSAPPFNIDSDQPMTPARARRFGVLGAILGKLPWDEGLTPVFHRPRNEQGAWVWRLASDDGSHQGVWVLAPPRYFATRTQSYRVSLGRVPAGSYRLQWWDDVSGEPVGAERAVAHAGGELVIESPPLQRHLAARLEANTARPASARR